MASRTQLLRLHHVLLFHRHGDRAPVLTQIGNKFKFTPEDEAFWASRIATDEQFAALERVAKTVGANASLPPNTTPSYGSWPCGILTQKGIEHMRGKGRRLREQYGHMLPTSTPGEHDVYVLSSSVPRTVQSVQCLLHGMFHDGDEEQEDEAAKRVPLYVHTYERNVLAPQHPLHVFNEIEMIVSDEVAKREQHERESMEKLGQHLRESFGIPDDQPVPWTAIRDALTCRGAHGLPLPEGITQDMVDQINEYDAWLWHRLYTRKDFCHKAFKHGAKEVYDHLKRVVDKDSEAPKPRIAFFSAHDNSIMALVGALQLQIGRALPEYGTIVAFEVYEDPETSEFFIKARFDEREVPFAGHEHDVLTPFKHVEALAQDFLAYKQQ